MIGLGIDAETRELLDAAIVAALRGGDEAMAVYRGQFGVERKADDSPITEADRRSQEAILGVLRERTPGLPVVSEEAAEIPYEVRRAWRRHWLVDPLDGTKEFVKRNGEFTVNIAMIEQGYPVLGVVLVPVQGALYAGGRGAAFAVDAVEIAAASRAKGGMLELCAARGRELASREARREDDAGITALVSRSHLDDGTRAFLARLEAGGRSVRRVSAGSAKKLCLLAEGGADVYPRFSPTMEWDIAAGQAVLEAAGGLVLDAVTHKRFVYGKERLVNPSFVALAPGRDPGYYLNDPPQVTLTSRKNLE